MATLVGVATPGAADVTDFGGSLLPTIPSTAPPTVGDLIMDAVPIGRARPGIWVSPNVAVDRLVSPRCLFVGNLNSGSGQAVQRTSVQSVLMNCRN